MNDAQIVYCAQLQVDLNRALLGKRCARREVLGLVSAELNDLLPAGWSASVYQQSNTALAIEVRYPRDSPWPMDFCIEVPHLVENPCPVCYDDVQDDRNHVHPALEAITTINERLSARRAA